MVNGERFGMRIVTAELFLDELLTRIFNNVEDAQKPINSPAWNVRSSGIKRNSLRLDSKWGGRLYGAGVAA